MHPSSSIDRSWSGATPRRRRTGLALGLFSVAVVVIAGVRLQRQAADVPPAPALAPAVAGTPAEPARTEGTAGADVRRSLQTVSLPTGIRLDRADGTRLSLRDALFDGRPVVLSFMYSSCATVCPVTNQTLVALETALGERRPQVNTVSVSIDPDHDSVQALSDYARRTGARGSFFTSDPASSESVQRAFDVWRGDKMNHQPVFLIGTAPDKPWVRLDGLVSARRLMDELARVRAGDG